MPVCEPVDPWGIGERWGLFGNLASTADLSLSLLSLLTHNGDTADLIGWITLS